MRKKKAGVLVAQKACAVKVVSESQPTCLCVTWIWTCPMAARDGRRLEVVADGLPLFGGVQLAIDTTLVSPTTVQPMMGLFWKQPDVGKNRPRIRSPPPQPGSFGGFGGRGGGPVI